LYRFADLSHLASLAGLSHLFEEERHIAEMPVLDHLDKVAAVVLAEFQICVPAFGKVKLS
jgi:hypothetical protein